jgi:hypothetical protein
VVYIKIYNRTNFLKAPQKGAFKIMKNIDETYAALSECPGALSK